MTGKNGPEVFWTPQLMHSGLEDPLFSAALIKKCTSRLRQQGKRGQKIRFQNMAEKKWTKKFAGALCSKNDVYI